MNIALLVLSILEKVVGIVSAALANPSGTTPEKVRDDLTAIIKAHDDNWLAAEVKKYDAKFNLPG